MHRDRRLNCSFAACSVSPRSWTQRDLSDVPLQKVESPMRNLLFDTPWWLLAGLAVIAVTLLVSGNNRQDKNLKRGGLFFLGLLILLSLLSYFVDTDIEKVTKRTKLVAKSVEKRDWPTFESLLDPHIHFAHYDDRKSLVEGA